MARGMGWALVLVIKAALDAPRVKGRRRWELAVDPQRNDERQSAPSHVLLAGSRIHPCTLRYSPTIRQQPGASGRSRLDLRSPSSYRAGICRRNRLCECRLSPKWQTESKLTPNRELKREQAWSRINLVPLILAEQDRDAYRRTQAALAREKEIMKDVPHWEVSPLFTPLVLCLAIWECAVSILDSGHRTLDYGLWTMDFDYGLAPSLRTLHAFDACPDGG